ncbi:HNH endonuclease [Shinella sp. H4-D48]|uniref:HNH endonuclease n=1 Tax=Shinella sp. H4-D48 TaxID=2925841 RepID=UPI001F5376A8|nr:HNH endonuclease [Shinella sp. H4-D48]UNK39382.1 HNH endonuclease [Shinella sp. H4-D48]
MKPYHGIHPETFFSKVDTAPGHGPDGDCHLWTGAVSDGGSGAFSTVVEKARWNFKAHRVAHWFYWQQDDTGLYCNHTCGVNHCVNPKHLYLSSSHRGIAPVRFLRLIDKTPGFGPSGDCWRFTAHISKSGYGCFSDDRAKPYPAHRYCYELIHGVQPPDVQICHSCDNRACVNPDHLWPGTHAENMSDRNAKGRQSRTRKYTKLSEDEARAIKFHDDRTHPAIAEAYGVSRSTVSFIKSGRRWGHLRP